MSGFDTLHDRKGTHSLKWDMLESIYGSGDLISMWVADSDFQAPPEVTEALIRRAEHGIFGYTVRPAAFYNSIIRWLKKRHDWPIEKDWLVYTPGVVAGLNWAVQVFSAPGDEVIVQPPVYHPFFSAVTGNGRILVENPLAFDGEKYQMDLEDLKAKISGKTRMILLCSPHNPVSRVWSREELAGLIDICLEKNILIVSDEIHSDLILAGHRHTPTAAVSEDAARIVLTFTAPSKTFNIAGLETAVAVIPNPLLRDRLLDFQQRIGAGMSNIFGIEAFTACYTHGEPWLEEQLRYLQRTADFFIDFTSGRMPEIRVIRPEGTYLLWADCRGLGYDAEALRLFFREKARIAVSDGPTFGTGGAGYVRFNLATPRANIAEALGRLQDAYGRRPRAELR